MSLLVEGDSCATPLTSRTSLPSLCFGFTAASQRSCNEAARVSAAMRKERCYRRAFPRLALDADFSGVCVYEVLHDRKPQPGSAAVTRPTLIDTVEPLENARKMLRRNARSRVRNSDPDPAVSGLSEHRDRTTSGVPYGVVDEVGKDLADRCSIGVYGRKLIRRADLERDSLGPRDVVIHAADIGCNRQKVDFGYRRLPVAGFQPRQIQEVIDYSLHAFSVRLDRRGELSPRFNRRILLD